MRGSPKRFARQRGPLRAIVESVLREFLRCGLLEHARGRKYCWVAQRTRMEYIGGSLRILQPGKVNKLKPRYHPDRRA